MLLGQGILRFWVFFKFSECVCVCVHSKIPHNVPGPLLSASTVNELRYLVTSVSKIYLRPPHLPLNILSLWDDLHVCKSDFPALIHFRFLFRWEKHGIPDMKAQEYHIAGTTLIHATIHRRPLMNPMFSPFKSTLGQSGQTINAHERSPGERQKVPLSSQCQGNQGNDLLLPKLNDDFFNLHSPWHFLAHQTLHHSLLAERLPVGFMGITRTPSSCIYRSSCLLPDRCPVTSRPFLVSACVLSPKQSLIDRSLSCL